MFFINSFLNIDGFARVSQRFGSAYMLHYSLTNGFLTFLIAIIFIITWEKLRVDCKSTYICCYYFCSCPVFSTDRSITGRHFSLRFHLRYFLWSHNAKDLMKKKHAWHVRPEEPISLTQIVQCRREIKYKAPILRGISQHEKNPNNYFPLRAKPCYRLSFHHRLFSYWKTTLIRDVSLFAHETHKICVCALTKAQNFTWKWICDTSY